MLKNKTLAIVLSIVAVIVVLWRILQKPEYKIPIENQAQVVAEPQDAPAQSAAAVAPAQAAQVANVNSAAGDVPVLDANSPQLLQPLAPDGLILRSFQELAPDFGHSAFSSSAEPGTVAAVTSPEAVLLLTGIVLEKNRRVALINGKAVREGDRLASGEQVVTIRRDGVQLRRGETTLFLHLVAGAIQGKGSAHEENIEKQ